MKIRIINNTSTAFYIYIRPADSVLKTFDAFSAYAHGKISAGSRLYTNINNRFYIAGMYQNPDRSAVVTTKLPLMENKHYEFSENGTIAVTDKSVSSVEVENKSTIPYAALFYGENSCILKKNIRPGFCSPFPQLPNAFCNIMLSLSDREMAQDFFKADDTNIFSKDSQELSATAADYMTLTLEENIGSGQVSISGPDYTPFSPYNVY